MITSTAGRVIEFPNACIQGNERTRTDWTTTYTSETKCSEVVGQIQDELLRIIQSKKFLLKDLIQRYV